ncbi:MAG: TAXI family TRAP transporter solute-binding subunit [Bradyrhizobium sp.]|jgi:TRAP-type uncharacterized transport system substrate-binding protein
MNSIVAPAWVRIVLVVGTLSLLTGTGLLTYHWFYRPTTLNVATGSMDGEAGRIISAIAARLAATNAGVRLNVVETSSALEAANVFSSGKTELAVIRGDVGDLSQAQAVIVIARAVALLIALPGSSLSSIADFKRTVVGVIAGETNRALVRALTNEYDLTRAGVTFKDMVPADARRAFETRQVGAVLAVVPLSEKYLSPLRSLFQSSAKKSPILVPIDSAGAIAEKERAYESFDVPKGTLRGAPPVPDEDLTTLKVSFYLVARKNLDNDLISGLTQALMNARRDLLSELPILAQMTSPDIDPDAYLPVHPGAAAYYNGTQQSFLDKWGNAIFLVPMVFGALVSVLAAAWKFVRAGKPLTHEQALDSLYALASRIRATEFESDLSDIEGEIDRVLQAQRAREKAGDESALDVTALNVAAHRLQSLIHDRRTLLAIQPGSKTRVKRAETI